MPRCYYWDGGGGGGSLPNPGDRSSVREWWHKNLREHGRYSCYAIILVLPSDAEAIDYLEKYGQELHLISGADCLIVTLNQNQFSVPAFDQTIWEKAVDEHASSGYSATVAHLLDIGFEEFPCLVVFEDIRSSNHIVVTLKSMSVEEITEKLRAVFSTIQSAVGAGENPLSVLESCRDKEDFVRLSQVVVGQVRALAGKTFEKVMEAWIKATIK